VRGCMSQCRVWARSLPPSRRLKRVSARESCLRQAHLSIHLQPRASGKRRPSDVSCRRSNLVFGRTCVLCVQPIHLAAPRALLRLPWVLAHQATPVPASPLRPPLRVPEPAVAAPARTKRSGQPRPLPPLLPFRALPVPCPPPSKNIAPKWRRCSRWACCLVNWRDRACSFFLLCPADVL
jgi:hypothetical protein